MSVRNELSSASHLGTSGSWNLSNYFNNLTGLFSAKGVDAFTSPTLTQSEMPAGYEHVDPSVSGHAVKEGITAVEKSAEADEPYFISSADGSLPSTPQTLQYIDAPLAEVYGMDASTAYQEALANTAYQRKVKDLKAAGLNPVLGYSGAGAASFYGTQAASSSGGVSYGSLGSGKSASDAAEKAKVLQYWLPQLAGVAAGAYTAVSTRSVAAGLGVSTLVSNGVNSALSLIRNHA